MAGRQKTIPIFVPHWGCPCACVFCDQKQITGQKEEMTAEKAAAIIHSATKERKAEDYIEVGFFGGSFTGIPAFQQEALLGVAHEALLSGKIDSIRLSTRPDYIDEAVLARLQRFGVSTVELGAQSMDDAVLTACHRGHTANQTKEAAAQIRDAGLKLGLQMMLGLPQDTKELTQKTVDEFIAMKPVCVRIYPTLVLRGTALCRMFEAGAYEPLSLDEAVERCALAYRCFTDSGIDVIRMGLLEPEQDSVCAGPWHPAFGELVLSKDCFFRLSALAKPFAGTEIIIQCHPRYVSIAVGQERSNIHALYKVFSFKKILIEQNPMLEWGELVVLQKP